jgi:hypothetical protein
LIADPSALGRGAVAEADQWPGFGFDLLSLQLLEQDRQAGVGGP